jgi:MFS family permease
MYSTIFQVINYNIFEAFPDHKMAVNFFISAPYAVVMIVSFISPVIYIRTNRKYALLTASIIFTLSALLFTHQSSIYGFITVNLICGATAAYINVAAVTLIAELYVDENVKAKYMGYYNAAMAAVGSIFSVIAGYLATETWIGAFNTYWSAALMTLLIALFLPSLPKQLFIKENEDEKEKANITALGKRFWILTLNFLILGITYFVPGFFLSLYIAEHGLGDITYAGIALSLDTLGGAIFAFFFGYTYKKFGSYSSVAAFILMSIVIFLLYFMPNPIMLPIIVMLMGASYMTTISYAYQESSRVVPKSCLSLAMGIIVGVQYLAVFLAAYVTTGLMHLFKTELLTPILIFPASWILFFALTEYLSIKAYERKRC